MYSVVNECERIARLRVGGVREEEEEDGGVIWGMRRKGMKRVMWGERGRR